MEVEVEHCTVSCQVLELEQWCLRLQGPDTQDKWELVD